jgi:hypothetical protein
MRRAAIALVVAAACHSAPEGPLVYSEPARGALRLVKSKAAKPTAMVLDLVVGDAALRGFSTGFDLPIDATKVTLASFTPGTALDPGTAPTAAKAALPSAGPLAGMLVVAVSQKAAGVGAVATDSDLAPGAVLLSIEFDPVMGAAPGVVFDGTAAGFALPSGGLRDRQGAMVVDASGVAIGKLTVQ